MQHDTRNGSRADLEHSQAVLQAECRARKQLATLAPQWPDHLITAESYPGRGLRFVARARKGTTAAPWLVITDDLDELQANLPEPGTRPPARE